MVMVEYNIPNALLRIRPYFRNPLLYNLYSLLCLPCHYPFLQIQNHIVHPQITFYHLPCHAPSLQP